MTGARQARARGRRRIWCETLAIDEVAREPVVDLLRRFSLELLIAVRPGEERALARLLERARGAGVRVGIWPMLDDKDGRWASRENADRFAAFAEELVVSLGTRGLAPAELAVDLEPPFGEVRDLVGASVGGPRRGAGGALAAWGAQAWAGARSPEAWSEGVRAFTRLHDRLTSRGIEVSAAVIPLVLLDPPARGAEGSSAGFGFYQACLGTPADAPTYGHVSAMLYTSMIEGWSRGIFGRRDVGAILRAGSAAARARWGERAGVSLGVVGTGALGNEPVYRDPKELEEDVAAALACGIEDLSLFDLGGVLRRPPAERWLAAFVETSPAAAARARSFRAEAALGAAWLLGRAAGLVTAPLRSRPA